MRVTRTARTQGTASEPVQQPELGATPGREPCDLLVRHGYLLTLDPRRTVYADGAVAIKGRTIAAVGPDGDLARRFDAGRVLDARGAPVHPGFVDCHVHTTIHTTRGVFPDVPRFVGSSASYADWYNALYGEDEYAATLLACLEMLRAGTTCFMEPGTVFEPDAAAAAIRAVGIRGSLGDPFLWDYTDFLPLSRTLERAPARTGRALGLLGGQLWRNQDPDALVRGHVALYGGVTASDELTLAASECARSNGVALTQHQSARAPEAAADDARFGRHPLVHYADIGALGPHCAFVHMNMLRPDEHAPIRDAGLSLVWCAANSMNWGNGAAIPYRGSIPDLFHQGTNVALGSDTGKFGMDQQAVAGYLLARDRDAAPLEAEDLIEIATLGGARAMQMADRIGSLEPGRRADLVIRTADVAEVQPGVGVPQSVVLSGRSRSVDTVLVDGQIVLRGGRSTRVDEGVVYETARTSLAGVLRRSGIRPQPRWEPIP